MTKSSELSRPAAVRDKSAPTTQPLCVRKVNALMVSMDLGPRDVDQRAGWKEGSFSAYRSRGFPDEACRAKVERAFGHRLFCDERTWLLRDACFRRYSFDPAFLVKSELLAWIEKLSLLRRVPANPTHAQLVSVLLDHMAIKPR